MGSTYLQGYLLARPMTAAQLEAHWTRMYVKQLEVIPAR
jgi:EAL domain-containing protein (putative c-di-GMP-specific phosphodiesterase class I)